ncbi:MAG: GAF domain-containing protein [Bacteroidota bacterium]
MFKKNNTKLELIKIISGYTLIILVAFFYALWFYMWHVDKDKVVTELYSLKSDILSLEKTQTNFLDKESLDELLFSTDKNTNTENFKQRFEIAQNKIKELSLANKKDATLNILYSSLNEDLLKLRSENKLFLKYIKEAGNEHTGIYSHLLIAENNFQKKLTNTTGLSNIQVHFNQIKVYRKVFYLYNDIQILNISNNHIDALLKELSRKKGNSNNYYYLRLIDGLQEYKQVFNLFARKLMQIGIRKGDGIRQNLATNYQKIDNRIVEAIDQVELKQTKGNIFTLFIIVFLILLSISINIIFHFQTAKRVKLFLKESEQYFSSLIKGNLVKAPDEVPNDDYIELQKQMNFFSEKLDLSSKMMAALIKAESEPFTKKSYKNAIFPEINILNKHIENLNKQLKTETNETYINKWIRKGLASFSEVLRQNFEKPQVHAKEILSNLVDYLNIPMGAIYLPATGKDNSFDLVASIAFGKQKHYQRPVIKGEGIIGTAVEEKKIINITDIPEDYFKISSGFGEAKPKNIIVLPIKLENKVYGIIELASLNKFKKFELEFINELSKYLGASFAISAAFLETTEKFEQNEKEFLLYKMETDNFKDAMNNLKQENIHLEDKNLESEIINESINTFALVAKLDLDGNILEINNAFIEVLKKSKKTIISTSYWDYKTQTGKENEVKLEQLWNDVRSGNICNLERNILVAQKNIWLSETYIPIKDKSGKVNKIKVIAFNKTDLKTLETDLDKQKQNEKDLYDQIAKLKAELENLNK